MGSELEWSVFEPLMYLKNIRKSQWKRIEQTLVAIIPEGKNCIWKSGWASFWHRRVANRERCTAFHCQKCGWGSWGSLRKKGCLLEGSESRKQIGWRLPLVPSSRPCIPSEVCSGICKPVSGQLQREPRRSILGKRHKNVRICEMYTMLRFLETSTERIWLM